MDFSTLDPLIRPRSLAVVGASDDATRIGGRPIAYMKTRGFHGELWPVNPKRDTVQGIKCFSGVEALPAAPDVGLIAVPGGAALDAVEALGEKGCKAAIMFTAGFAETGDEGALMQDKLVAAARRHGMRLLGPNCLGLFNDAIGFYPIFSSSFEQGWPVPGRIGIASQSGAYGTHLYSLARNRNIGTPICVTTGNEAEVALGDVLGWMAEAPEVDVICAYAEGIRESEKFLAALDLARRNRKPIVMMKVGRSALGGLAAQSHTASIAGDDAVTDAVLAEYGVVRARNTEELLDIAYAATRRVYPARNTLGVVTVSGGAGVLISDVAESLDFPMPPMPEETQRKLLGFVPFCAPRNPVDCTAQAFNQIELVGEFARATAAEGGYSSLLAFFTQVGGSPTVGPKVRAQMKPVVEAHPDRLWAVSIIAPPETATEWEKDGFLVFEDPTRAVVALHAMGRFGEAFARGAEAAPQPAPVALPATAPSEAKAKQILDAAGVPAVPEEACADAEAAVAAARRFGFPVVMKILSPDILHKSEIGGVLLDVADEDAVREGFATLMARAKQHAPGARIEGALVAKQIKGAVEMAMGILRDPVFGPVAMVGLGGVFIEVLKDVAFRRCPFDTAEAERLIRSLKGFPLLDGARGRPKADVPALAQALSALSLFAAGAGPRLLSVDVNPVLVLPEGAYAADAVIELDAAEG
ncbi:acetate--CoA ligase family protein [Sabulicella glaciei]|uniref:Acetate--CoA ligase family protein n=1 Tax=Sabulicella glaciei TaxID=2984948 RepID=A0ABT3NVT2_9PROT|nr:acetate--CoA ligase family protein [Roseococcus sp. MDT2-1-1]MCW8086252.1 acetate--CoA ligase family protein [Roseococcus sp. MDT2-1-1]